MTAVPINVRRGQVWLLLGFLQLEMCLGVVAGRANHRGFCPRGHSQFRHFQAVSSSLVKYLPSLTKAQSARYLFSWCSSISEISWKEWAISL